MIDASDAGYAEGDAPTAPLFEICPAARRALTAARRYDARRRLDDALVNVHDALALLRAMGRDRDRIDFAREDDLGVTFHVGDDKALRLALPRVERGRVAPRAAGAVLDEAEVAARVLGEREALAPRRYVAFSTQFPLRRGDGDGDDVALYLNYVAQRLVPLGEFLFADRFTGADFDRIRKFASQLAMLVGCLAEARVACADIGADTVFVKVSPRTGAFTPYLHTLGRRCSVASPSAPGVRTVLEDSDEVGVDWVETRATSLGADDEVLVRLCCVQLCASIFEAHSFHGLEPARSALVLLSQLMPAVDPGDMERYERVARARLGPAGLAGSIFDALAKTLARAGVRSASRAATFKRLYAECVDLMRAKGGVVGETSAADLVFAGAGSAGSVCDRLSAARADASWLARSRARVAPA